MPPVFASLPEPPVSAHPDRVRTRSRDQAQLGLRRDPQRLWTQAVTCETCIATLGKPFPDARAFFFCHSGTESVTERAIRVVNQAVFAGNERRIARRREARLGRVLGSLQL